MQMNNFIKKHKEIIPQDIRSVISKRYHVITRAVNNEFWNSISENLHSLYVGSYGRGTAVDTSDIDILVEIPEQEYKRYDSMRGNGQSRLLQALRSALLNVYPRTEIRADGQVVKVHFTDGMKMEILPAFPLQSYYLVTKEYRYPDTNDGGHWLSTNPKAEQEAMEEKNRITNGLLFDTCKHIRYIRDNYFKSYHLSGITIDSFIYKEIGNWRWTQSNEESSSQCGDYEKYLLKKYNETFSFGTKHILQAPGSNQEIDVTNSVECLGKVLRFISQ